MWKAIPGARALEYYYNDDPTNADDGSFIVAFSNEQALLIEIAGKGGWKCTCEGTLAECQLEYAKRLKGGV